MSSGRSRNPEIDLYPEALRAEIDRINAVVGPRISTAASTGQASRRGGAETYDAAVIDLFAALDALEEHLAARDFLVGESPTEADLRLFPTLVRFENMASYGALRCNLRRLADYPRLLGYTRRIHVLPGIAATVKLDHVKRHYWDDHEMINRRIVPVGPACHFATMPAARAA